MAAKRVRMRISIALQCFQDLLTTVLATFFVLILNRKSHWINCHRPKYKKVANFLQFRIFVPENNVFRYNMFR